MSEFWANASQFLMYAFEGVCIQKLFRVFLKPRWENLKSAHFAVGIVWVIVRYMAGAIMGGNDSSVVVGRLFVYAGGIFCFCVIWYVDKIRWKLFLVLLFLSLRELSFFAGYTLFVTFGDWSIDGLLYGFEQQWMGDKTFLNAAIAVANVSLFLMGFMEGILLYAAVYVISKLCDRSCWKKTDRELIFYMLPAVAGLLITIMLRMSMFIMEDGRWVILYDRYPMLKIIVPCISLVLLVSVVFNFWLYQKMSQQNEKQKEQQILQNQIVQMQSAMQEMERLYDGIRGVRHDMKNQMLALKGILSKAGEGRETIQDFVSDMYHSVEQLDYGLHTGNSICDVVIGSKFAWAKEKLMPICLNADNFTMAQSWEIKAYDMGIILNNGLDNAIEAIGRMREKEPKKEAYIMLKSYVRGGMVFVEIENNFSGELEFEKGSHIPVSHKEGDAHGMGLRNIRNCARKYGGEVDCITQGDKFVLSIMLCSRAYVFAK